MNFVVNCEEIIGKTVGRRVPAHSLIPASGEIASSNFWRKQGFRPHIRKGVYRFHSHEEADPWRMNHLTRNKKN